MFETESVPEPVINTTQVGGNLVKASVSPKPNKLLLILPAIAVVVLGAATGYLISGNGSGAKQGTFTTNGVVSKSDITVGSEFGGKDAANFPDQALGVIETGGIDGEGTHKLLREGGPSQTVYLTSSTLDLEQFVSRKVQIFGETFKAQKAGWLMDVGRVKILE